MSMSRTLFNEVTKADSSYNLMDAPFLPSDIFNHCFEIKENPQTTLRVLAGEEYDKILLDALTSKFNPQHNETIRVWLKEFIEQFKEQYQDD